MKRQQKNYSDNLVKEERKVREGSSRGIWSIARIAMMTVAVLFVFGLGSVRVFASYENNTPDKAKEITLETEISDSIPAADENNWYKFSTTEDGYVTISLSHGKMTKGYWNIEIMDSSRVLLGSYLEGYYYDKGRLYNIGLPKGTYYIRVNTGYSDDKLVNVNYGLRVDLTASSSWETEDNNYIGKADSIKVNSEVNGNINSYKDDVDYYVFSVNEDGYSSIEFSYIKSPGIASDYYWRIYLYKYSEIPTENDLIISKGFSGYKDELSSEKFELKKGKYLVKITSGGSSSDYDYKFKISFGPEWAKDYIFSVDGNDVVLEKYIGSSTDLVVPAKFNIEGKEYKTVINGSNSFFMRPTSYGFNESITSFKVEKGVALKDGYCFLAGLVNLKSVDLSGLDTSHTTGMQSMFESCKSLTSLDLSNFDTSNVTSMAGMFWGCDNLKDINVSSFDTSNVTSMRSMFSCCWSLEKLDLSNFDTRNVTTMWGMFFGDESLKCLDLSNFNTDNVTDMTGVFEFCNGLEYLDISSWDMSKAEYTAAFVERCACLKEIKTPKVSKDTALPYSMCDRNTDGTIGTTLYYALDEAPANSVLVYIPLESVTVSPKELKLNPGETAELQLVFAPSNFSRKSDGYFESSDESIVKVNWDGTLTAVSAGTVTITGRYSESYEYLKPENRNIVDYGYHFSMEDFGTVTVGEGASEPDNPDKPKEYIPSDIDKDLAEGHCLMYRMYNPNSGEHFYTGSKKEGNKLVDAGWNYEGIAWEGPTESNTPVYRLYNPNVGEHHYTPNKKERDKLIKLGWNDEGIGWYSDDNEGTPLYRLYNPNATTGNHHYTTSTRERDKLVKIGWNDEGIGWYGY